MEEIREECDDDQLDELLGGLMERSKYVFGNGEPDEETGLQLFTSICSENAFYELHKNPLNFYSDNHLAPILGDNLQEEFIPYLKNLLKEGV